MRVKSVVGSLLRVYPPLFRSASKLFHTINTRYGNFETLSPGLPPALTKAFELAQQSTKGSVGDYYEFGLYTGSSFLTAYKTCQQLGLDETRFFGFDSFAGLPPVQDSEVTDGRFFEGQFACSKDQVENNLTQEGLDWSRATLIEGYYEASLTEELKSRLSTRQASVILMDCDLYSSTATALNWIADLCGVTTVILFDDWDSFGKLSNMGQQKAFKEFLDQNPKFRAEPLWEFSPHGKTFKLHQS